MHRGGCLDNDNEDLHWDSRGVRNEGVTAVQGQAENTERGITRLFGNLLAIGIQLDRTEAVHRTNDDRLIRSAGFGCTVRHSRSRCRRQTDAKQQIGNKSDQRNPRRQTAGSRLSAEGCKYQVHGPRVSICNPVRIDHRQFSRNQRPDTVKCPVYVTILPDIARQYLHEGSNNNAPLPRGGAQRKRPPVELYTKQKEAPTGFNSVPHQRLTASGQYKKHH